MNPVVLQPLVLAVSSNFPSFLSAPEAYIDPNTGGMLFQVLAIVFTFLSGFMLFFSARIRMAIARLSRRLRGLLGRDTEVE